MSFDMLSCHLVDVCLAPPQNDAYDLAEPGRVPHRSALSARRISSMPPPAPVTASRAPRRDPPTPDPTPAGPAGESGAKRLVLQQQSAAPAKHQLEPQQLQVHTEAVACIKCYCLPNDAQPVL